MPDRLIMVPGVAAYVTDVAEGNRLALAVPDLAEHGEDMVVIAESLLVRPGLLLHAAQVVQRGGLALRIPQLPVDGQGLFGVPQRVVYPAQSAQGDRASVECLRLS